MNRWILWAMCLQATAALAQAPSIGPEIRHQLKARGGAALVMSLPERKIIAQFGATIALEESHATGSAIKPLTALLALEAGAIRADTAVLCRRDVSSGGRTLRCSHAAVLLPITVTEALAISCNYFFAEAGRRLGAAAIERGFRQARFDSQITDPAMDATGHGGVRATLRQMLEFQAALAAGGLPFRAEHQALVRRGLEAAVRDGTASPAAAGGVVVAGKTGTAARTDVPYRNSGWFAGWAPASEPRVAVAVWVHRGEGRDAAFIAGQVLRAHLTTDTTQLRIQTSEGIRGVDLETYVAAVVAGEAGGINHPEALKAIAVAARTYALRHRGRHATEGFDFCSLTHCQVFAGGSSLAAPWAPPAPPGRLAAVATAGETLRYRGKLIAAYHSGACGGYTQSAANVWPDEAAPYLPAQSDPFCAREPWNTRIPAAQLETAVRGDRAADPGGRLESLTVSAHDSSGRVRQLRVRGSSTRLVNGNYFRFLVDRQLGWDKLKSTLFDVRRDGGDFIFEGRGFGHGIGLCQDGAARMAAAGHHYRRILAQYFPETLTLRFPAGQDADAEDVLARIEAARTKLAARGVPKSVGMGVVIHATPGDFIAATGRPGWSAAASDASTLHLQPPRLLRERGTLDATVAHEYVHVALWRVTDARVPVWFREGVAMYFAGEQPEIGPAEATAPRPLNDVIERPWSRDQMRRAYARAVMETRTLARDGGDAALLRILQQPTPQELQRLMAIGRLPL